MAAGPWQANISPGYGQIQDSLHNDTIWEMEVFIPETLKLWAFKHVVSLLIILYWWGNKTGLIIDGLDIANVNVGTFSSINYDAMDTVIFGFVARDQMERFHLLFIRCQA